MSEGDKPNIVGMTVEQAIKTMAEWNGLELPQQPASSGLFPVSPHEIRYSASTWKGIPSFQCNFCAFLTTRVDMAEDHYDLYHGPKYQETGLLDDHGYPIVRQISRA